MKSITRIFMFFLPALVMLSSCHKDTDKTTDLDNLFGAYVTLTSVNADGATFQAQKEGAYTTPVTLVASWTDQKIDQFKVGDRYYIYYTNGTIDEPFREGAINLYLVAACTNGSVERAPLATITPMATGTYSTQYEPTITGSYVNLFITSASNLAKFGLYVDEETLNNDYPEVYVCVDSRNVVSGGQEYFGSFNIESVWQLASAKGFKLHYELKGTPKVKTFSKETSSITPSN